MTKASVEMEKERDRYENTIDGLRDRIESLEAQLSDERITCLASSVRKDQRVILRKSRCLYRDLI